MKYITKFQFFNDNRLFLYFTNNYKKAYRLSVRRNRRILQIKLFSKTIKRSPTTLKEKLLNEQNSFQEDSNTKIETSENNPSNQF